MDVSASAAWLDFKYANYSNGQCNTAQQTDSLQANGSTADCYQDLSGEPADYAPEWSASVGVSHRQPVSPGILLASSVDINYSDEYYLAADLDPASLQDTHTKVNARIAMLSESGWQVAVSAKNLLDEETRSTGEDIPFGNGNFYANAICRQLPAACPIAIDQLLDKQGAFYGVTERSRSYSIDLRYQF